MSFVGGSAPAMAHQVTEGFTLVSAVSLKRLTLPELEKLQFELEKRQRDIRGEAVDLADHAALQKRNRRLSRLDSGLRTIRGTLQTRRRMRV